MAIVVLTGWTLMVLRRYAADTKKIADASVSQTENAAMPILVVIRETIFKPEGKWYKWSIQNQGFGPALNIRFTGYNEGSNESSIKETYPLGAGDERFIGEIEDVLNRWLKFEMWYESLSGLEYSTTVTLGEHLHTKFIKPKLT